MSFSIHPFCENGNNVPANCVHAGPVSLGLLPKDYKADTSNLWRAGIDPGSNLLVASTTFARGFGGITAATSTPRYWWISGPANDQNTLEAKVKEVVGRLPERAVNNYVPFSDYATAYNWAKTNGYALINCNYPAYLLGDAPGNDTRPIVNIESGFLPSYDGSQSKIRNLANPNATAGFPTGSNPALPHESITMNVQQLGSLNTGIGTESGILYGANGHISQVADNIVSNLNNGLVVEGVFGIPDGAALDFTLFQARAANDDNLVRLSWSSGTGWRVVFGPSTVAYEQTGPVIAPAAGQYYFCVSIPRVQTASEPVRLYISGQSTPTSNTMILAEQGGGSLSWNTANVRFSFGCEYASNAGVRPINRLYSMKIHDITGAWIPTFHDMFYNTNWPIVQNLYGATITP